MNIEQRIANFRAFLQLRGPDCFEQFMQNLGHDEGIDFGRFCRSRRDEIADWVSVGFCWAETDQGDKYWRDISSDWHHACYAGTVFTVGKGICKSIWNN